MANKMLIDATHPEETRVVVLRGNRVEEFDFESASRRQLRGNIYLAKVTRVEPSLQAAFVDYGGNRHGFLAFSEIHPDYYQIPVADRQALIAEEERAHRAADAEVDRRAGRRRGRQAAAAHDEVKSAPIETEASEQPSDDEARAFEDRLPDDAQPFAPEHGETDAEPGAASSSSEADALAAEAATVAQTGSWSPAAEEAPPEIPPQPIHAAAESEDIFASENVPVVDDQPATGSVEDAGAADEAGTADAESLPVGDNGSRDDDSEDGDADEEEEIVESVGGGDAMEEVPERMPRLRRQYKIQEVIKRRQIMLVQVVKEERGTKGAALTTYLSLAGRYSVLMPNTARGGGISRKITSALDRKRLKAIAQDLEVPEGMGVILRTAGANRTKAEVKRDFEYLIRVWEQVRDLTLNSTAPTLVYEEGSLIKRSIRDLYNKDIDEVLVAGDEAYREAKEFMRMLMPSHAKNVKPYRDPQPIFTRYGIESQLDAMFSPTVQLRSGGYIVLNQTEALVSIDVNSGRATREHHIEDTALKTNMEAAEEVARQLRLRDLAGLIVIDFIDMDEKRNNRAVERRLKECLRHDRARIQVGRISHFGLLEMSRQRIRTGVLESSTEKCAYCGGTGHTRSVSSVTLQLLRSLEDILIKGATHNLIVRTRSEIALYVLNHKRAHLRELEQRFGIAITINADPTIGGQQPFAIDRGEQVQSLETARALLAQQPTLAPAAPVEEEDVEDEDDEEETEAAADGAPEPAPANGQSSEQGEGGRRRRRRRRRARSERPDHAATDQPHVEEPHEFAGGGDYGTTLPADLATEAEEADGLEPGPAGETAAERERRRRRRGRRGGRRRRGRDGEQPFIQEEFGTAPASEAGDTVEVPAEIEPELDRAVADFDHGAPHEEPPQPAIDEVAVPPPEPQSAEPEPARRRSTVREPAPTLFAEHSPPPPADEVNQVPEPAQPAAVAETTKPDEPTPESDRSDQPRRTGWWSRRFASDKG
jgi:ribonuclease E